VSVSESELLDDLRPRTFAIAYRMLGSVSEAEDVVQEALLRVHNAIERGEEISSPRAYAATVATRLAIDELRSARARRETYVGEWLPEPIAASEEDPAAQAEQADSLSLAFLVVLESLTPEQRAAFLLHDVFDYDYDKVAEIIGTSQDNARQLASRARRHVHDGRPRFDPSAEQREQLAASFFAAAEQGEFEELEALLAEDVELHGDGGGLAPAIRHPVFGRAKVAQMLGNWLRLGLERIGDVQFRRVVVNGQPGVEYLDSDGKLIGVMSLDIADGKVQAIRSIVNPEKLDHLGPVADANELLSRIRESR
jgi:RNA polymerase sigma-70 factor (TIGR02957 family)